MRLYRFHCVGGGAVVIDRTGRWIEIADGVPRAAEDVARALMAQDRGADWSGWQVEAYDADGRCLFKRMFGDVVRGVRAA